MPPGAPQPNTLMKGLEQAEASLRKFKVRSRTLVDDSHLMIEQSRQSIDDSRQVLAEMARQETQLRSAQRGIWPSTWDGTIECRQLLSELPDGTSVTTALAVRAGEVMEVFWHSLDSRQQKALRSWLLDRYLALAPDVPRPELEAAVRWTEVIQGALDAMDRIGPPKPA